MEAWRHRVSLRNSVQVPMNPHSAGALIPGQRLRVRQGRSAPGLSHQAEDQAAEECPEQGPSVLRSPPVGRRAALPPQASQQLPPPAVWDRAPWAPPESSVHHTRVVCAEAGEWAGHRVTIRKPLQGPGGLGLNPTGLRGTRGLSLMRGLLVRLWASEPRPPLQALLFGSLLPPCGLLKKSPGCWMAPQCLPGAPFRRSAPAPA